MFQGFVWCAFTLIAVIVFSVGHWFRHNAITRCGAVLLACCSASLACALWSDLTLEMNPLVSDAQLIGKWKGDSHQLDLRGDGTALFRTSTHEAVGRWARKGDFIIRVDARGAEPSYRIVTSLDRLHLTRDFVDPDEWDGRLLFRKSSD